MSWGAGEGRSSQKVTSKQIWRRQGSGPCTHLGDSVPRRWNTEGRLWGMLGSCVRRSGERPGGELREETGGCPGVCGHSENFSLSS